jgi:hypothetical protein
MFAIILINLMLLTNSISLGNAQENEKSNPYIGVNMQGYHTYMTQNRESEISVPSNYYENSFSNLSENGLNVVRYIFTWEGYEKNPNEFFNELKTVARTADKYNVSIIYANDQYHISSFLDSEYGYGFPSLFFNTEGQHLWNNDTGEAWWSNWYKRSIQSLNGTDGWRLNANFLKGIVSAVDNYSSTVGYEILNEPVVYNTDQWQEIGNYNSFITEELRKSTGKFIFFDRQVPSDIGGHIQAYPENMAKMAPRNLTNVVYKGTLYGAPFSCTYAEDRLNTAVKTAQILGIPLYMGEFNIGKNPKEPIADINQTEINAFYNKFAEVDSWGWSYWLWSFEPRPIEGVQNYNLAVLSPKGLETTKYFELLSNTTSKFRSNQTLNDSDTICPTSIVSNINGVLLPVPSPPVVELVNTSATLSIHGKAYDIGSGLKSVEIRLDEGGYVPVMQEKGNWYNWSIDLPIYFTADGMHKLVVRAIDNSNNTKFLTLRLYNAE